MTTVTMPSMMNIHLVLGQHATEMIGDFLPPTTITCNTVHLRNRKSKQLVCVSDVNSASYQRTYASKCPSNDRCCKEQRHPPLQLVALVVHRNEVDAAFSFISTISKKTALYDGPGNKPASKNPSTTRKAIRPSKFLTRPMPIVAIPHSIMMRESHVDGANFLRTRLLGTGQMLGLADTVVLSVRTLEQDIRDEEYEERYVVVATVHVKIFLESLDSCIADVRPLYVSV